MKKLLSILIVPLVAILMLCGCGRTMRTVDEVTKLFEYQTFGGSAAYCIVFICQGSTFYKKSFGSSFKWKTTAN